MKIIEYLKSFDNAELALQVIQAEPHNIKVDRVGDRVLLNYDMLSPKGTMADDCRALMLRLPDFEVLSFSFRRFYNHREGYAAPIDWSNAVCHEKVDGTLIVFYHDGEQWNFHTRGKIDATGPTSDGRSTFRERVLALLDSRGLASADELLGGYDRDQCWVYEYVGPYNRIVTQYPKEDLYLLAVTNRKTLRDDGQALYFTIFSTPKAFTFRSINEVIDSIASLPKLEEGYVVFDGQNRIKVKSPTYLAMHSLVNAGNAPTDDNFAAIALGGDTDEIKGYFPEFVSRIEAMELKVACLAESAELLYAINKFTPSQKDFALAVKDHPLSAWMFQRRSGKTNLNCREWMRANMKPEKLIAA